MKFTSIISTAALAASAIAQNVACLVDGQQVAVVDLDTGVCPFTVPSNLPVEFDFVSLEEYDVTFYYAIAQGVKFFTDIVEAGRLIEIPAKALFGTPGSPLFQVHLEQTPAANSTAAIRRRLLKQVELVKKAEIDDFLSLAKSTDGTEVPGSSFEVVALSDVSSTAPSGGVGSASSTEAPESTETLTEKSTTLVTITSCSDNKCSAATVPATASVGETTVDETVTTFTTYCPETTVVTITSCSDNKCEESTVPVTPVLTTGTIEGEVTSYYTYCPLTGETTVTEESTTIITITSCSDNKCHETTVPATPATTTSVNAAGETTTYTTLVECSTTPATTTPATVAGESTTVATSATATGSSVSPISTFEGAGYKFGVSALALAPIVGLLL